MTVLNARKIMESIVINQQDISALQPMEFLPFSHTTALLMITILASKIMANFAILQAAKYGVIY